MLLPPSDTLQEATKQMRKNEILLYIQKLFLKLWHIVRDIRDVLGLGYLWNSLSQRYVGHSHCAYTRPGWRSFRHKGKEKWTWGRRKMYNLIENWSSLIKPQSLLLLLLLFILHLVFRRLVWDLFDAEVWQKMIRVWYTTWIRAKWYHITLWPICFHCNLLCFISHTYKIGCVGRNCKYKIGFQVSYVPGKRPNQS